MSLRAAGWSVHDRFAISAPLATSAQLQPLRNMGNYWAFFSPEFDVPASGTLPTALPVVPGDRNGSLRDTAYLQNESPPGIWREDVAAWTARVEEMQRRFWEGLAALGPESFLSAARTITFVTRDRPLHDLVRDWLNNCEAADPIVAAPVLDVRQLAPGRFVRDIQVGPDGEFAALSSNLPTCQIEYRQHPRGIQPIRRFSQGHRKYQLHRYSSGAWTKLDLPATVQDLHALALANGRWLLHSFGGSATVLGTDGSEQGSLSIEEGVSQLRATRDDRLWVGYTDEGVYSHQSYEAAGAVCLDLRGMPAVRFSDLARRHGLPYIDDCTAITIGDDGAAWLYYYGEYPLVRLVAGRFDRIWRDFPVQGARGFAVSDRRALFAENWRYPEHLFLVDLETRAVRKLRPVEREGNVIHFDSAFGHGARLYLRSRHHLFVIEPEAWA